MAEFGQLGSATVTVKASFDTLAKDLRRGRGQVNKAAARSGKEAGKSFSNALSVNVKRVLGGLVAALGTRAVIRFADAWTLAGSKIAAATQISGTQAVTLDVLAESARNARTEFTSYIDLYSRFLRVSGKVNATSRDVATATDIVSKAFKAGGAATSEQTAGILQLSQALGSGVLAGDELRSIRENAPLIAQAIADEFETTIGGLKKLGAEGRLTAERIFQGILNAQSGVEAAFAATEATISDAFTNLRTSLIQFVGVANKSSGTSKALVKAISALADNLDIAAVAAAALGARALTPLVAKTLKSFVVAARAASVALVGMTTATGAATAAATALSRVMGLLGGPLGIILTLLGGVAAAYLLFADGADTARSAIDRLDGSVTKTQTAMINLQNAEQSLEQDTKRLERANLALADAIAAGETAAIQTANGEIIAINKRLLANEDLRQKYVDVLRAQQLALQTDAQLAQQAFRAEFGGTDIQELSFIETLASLGTVGIPVDVILEGTAEERLNARIDRIRKGAQERLQAGTATAEDLEFFTLEAELLAAQNAADDLAQGILNLGDSATSTGTVLSSDLGGGAKAAKGSFDTLRDSIQGSIAAEREARELIALTSANIGLEEAALQKLLAALRAEQEERALLAQIKEASANLTAEEVKQLTALATKLREVTVSRGNESRALQTEKEAIEDTERANQVYVDGLVDVIGTIDQAIQAGDSFLDVLLRIAEQILNMPQFQEALFGGASSGGGGGGIFSSLFGALSGGGSTGSGSGAGSVAEAAAAFQSQQTALGFAHGGVPKLGSFSLVGERGPELRMFDTPSRIFSNDDLQSVLGAGSTQITQNLSFLDAKGARQAAGSIARRTAELTARGVRYL